MHSKSAFGAERSGMSYPLSRPSVKARSDPSFINYPGSEDIPEELPYPQEYDYLWTEERNSRYEASGIYMGPYPSVQKYDRYTLHRALLEHLEH